MAKLLHTKKLNYIYPDSYDEKLLFIAIPIGAKYQQGNMTPGNIWSRTRSSWDQTSNSLTCKIISQPTPPLQDMLQLKGPVDIAR